MPGKGRVLLTAEDGSEEVFFVMEKAEIAGASYLLVIDSIEKEDVDALILKEEKDGEIVTYKVVSDDDELKIISKYMEELLDDVDIRVE
jgi:hypothetical protein